MKKGLTLLCVFVAFLVYSQNKQIIFGFDKIPQNLILNPGSETTYRYHFGIPLTSSVSAHSSTSGITISDILIDDSIGIHSGTDFNVKIANAINKLDNNDYAYFNTQIELINAGYKLNGQDYLSAGFYLETDVFTSLPKDILNLVNNGNNKYIGKNIDMSNLSFQAETLGILHFGLTRRINSKLTAGGRIKVYFGGTNVSSLRNKGTIKTIEKSKNNYITSINELDLNFKTSRVYNENGKKQLNKKNPFKGTFFGGNYGAGVDLGFTYHISEQFEVTGSVLDLGFITYRKDVKKVKYDGSHDIEGIQIDFNKKNIDYWKEEKEKFKKNIKTTKETTSYTVTRPLKANLAYAYSYGKSLKRATCHDYTYKDFYDNTVGIQFFGVSQPNGINLAATGFYQRKVSKHLNLKATYTIDDFSYTNFGFGMSLNIWRINLYGSIGNIISITDTTKSHTSSAQIGLNYIMN